MIRNCRGTFLFLVLLITACADTGERPTSGAGKQARGQFHVIAEDHQFAIIRLAPGQTLDGVAKTFLGDREEAWQLRELNTEVGEPGQLIAVPLQPLNVSAVYADGYLTVPILCYHQFSRGSKTSHQLEVSEREFEAQMAYLQAGGFNVISLRDLIAYLNSKKPVPPRSVVITIDDGFRSVYEIAYPILRKYGYPTTLFVYTDFMGGGAALSWQQVREMRDSGLMDIQAHAKSHSSLARGPHDTDDRLYLKRLNEEVDLSTRTIERQLGTRPDLFSYPYGNSSQELEVVLKEHGYLLAATVTRGDNHSASSPMYLHRTMIYSTHDQAQFQKLLRTYRREDLHK